MKERLKRLRSGDVIACIALFFAVAGGSALALQGRNSVDSGDIKPKAVKTSDLANNAVTSRKIKNNHVRTADIQNGQVRPADLAPTDPVHKVGTPGGTQFENGVEGDCIWANPPTGAIGDIRPNPAGFWKDGFGTVHLIGLAVATDGPGGDAACGGAGAEVNEDSVVFVLPPGYRPQNDQLILQTTDFAVVVGNSPIVTLAGTVPAGAVYTSDSAILVDGFTFRAAGAGTGLPRRTTGEGGSDLLGPIAELMP